MSQRGVVFFRDQDISTEEQHALSDYYGTPSSMTTYTSMLTISVQVFKIVYVGLGSVFF